MRSISATTARRLAITRQRLAGESAKPTPDGILDVAKDLGFLQLDPTNVVAPSHQLVVFSRVGPYQPKHLETLLWDERRLFESWAHAASIVVTEHYPIYRWMMRRVATGTGFWHGFTASGERQAQRVLAWMKANDALRRSMLRQIREGGPLPSRAFDQAGGAGDRPLGGGNFLAGARRRDGHRYPRPLHTVEIRESTCGIGFPGEAGTNRARQRPRRRRRMAGNLVRARG